MAKKPAAVTKTYVVKSPIWQDGEPVAPGASVEIEEGEGAKLVAAGVLAEAPQTPPPAPKT